MLQIVEMRVIQQDLIVHEIQIFDT